jgi:glutamate synthase domain-containing protein 1
MCGIVGLFLKDKSLEPKLGQMLTDMLITMTDRGPDSAGIAIYGTDADDQWKLTVQSAIRMPTSRGSAQSLARPSAQR